MGTLIGSPPNAIAAAALAGSHPIDVARWMLVGLPPALLLLGVAWAFLRWRYPAKAAHIELGALDRPADLPRLPRWRQMWVVFVFGTTVVRRCACPSLRRPTPSPSPAAASSPETSSWWACSWPWLRRLSSVSGRAWLAKTVLTEALLIR